MTQTFYIAWNKPKNEGVIFNREHTANQAAGKSSFDPVHSSLAEKFFDYYGSDGDCTVESIELEIASD